MFSKPKPKYNVCDYCCNTIYLKNEYIYHVTGPGKHDGKDICRLCLVKKLTNKLSKK